MFNRGNPRIQTAGIEQRDSERKPRGQTDDGEKRCRADLPPQSMTMRVVLICFHRCRSLVDRAGQLPFCGIKIFDQG